VTSSAPVGLSAALTTDLSSLRDRFGALYEASRIRLPGSYRADVVVRLVESVLESLAEALPVGELVPGSPALREAEKNVSFLASTWSSHGGSGFDLVAIVASLRGALLERAAADEVPLVRGVFDWFFALSADAYADAGVRSERERQRELLERGTPVVTLVPDVAAAFLVGAPDSYVLDGVFGRLMMTAVRVGARALVVDASGLESPSSAPCLVSLERFLGHRKLAGVVMWAVGLDEEGEHAWQRVAAATNVRLEIAPSVDRALLAALELGEHRLIKRPTT
jgi:hypothetical protein